MKPRVHLSIPTGLVLLASMVLLNSLLTVFGSILWGLYWPAFMIYGIAVMYFGWWGILLAMLTPFAASLLSVGDAPFYLYIPVNVLQALILAGSFKVFHIEPSLSTWRDRFRYLAFAVILSSFVGGAFAWFLRSFYVPPHDGSILGFAASWTVENFLPAVVPGIWLHTVIGSTYKSFAWESGGIPKPWIRQTLEYSAPWLLSLGIIGTMLIAIIAQQLGWQDINLDKAPGAWRQIQGELVEHIPALRWTALALCMSIIYSIGSTVQLAKRSWILMQAVRRHLPTAILSDSLLSGIESPAQRRPLTLVRSEISNFNSVANLLGPDQLIAWLNSYYSKMCEVCEAEGGAIVNLSGDGLLMVFGLGSSNPAAAQALHCALSLNEATARLNEELARSGLPAVQAGIAVNYGITLAGDLGSTNRRQFSLVGQTADVVLQMLHAAQSLPSGILPIVFSRDTALEAGLLANYDRESRFLEFSLPFLQISTSLFAIRMEALSSVREQVDRILR